jgi:PAS domain S-box-containing protein
MHADTTILATASLAEFVSAVGPAPLVVGSAVVIALVVIVAVAYARSRRRLLQDVRSVVQAVEELRSGRGRGHTELGERSRIGLVADAVRRLGVDLHSTWSEAETAAERWRAVTDATRDTAIITTDTDGDIRSFSAGASQLTGWDEAEVVSRPAAVLFDENAYKDLLPKLARRSLRTQGVTTRSTMVRRDGATFEAEVSVRMLMGSSSQPVGFMMLVRDVTEQIRLENELRDSERRYRGLVEGLTEGVVIVREGRVVYVNPAAEVLCGQKGPELLGTAWRDRVATGDLLVMESALDAVATGASGSEELRCTIIGADRDQRAEVRVKTTPVEFAGGAAVMLLVRDETAERRAEAELRRNESRLDAVLEATSDGVLVLADDPGCTVQMTNRAFAEMFGLRLPELLGASEDRLARLLHEANEGSGAVADRIVGEPRAGAPSVVTIGGESAREIRITVARLTGRTGESLGRIVACRDVTARRRSERELQEQAEKLQLSKVELEQSYRKLNEVNRKLAARGEELDRLNQELQRLDQMKSDLIGNVSHELQTPLVSIRGYTEMILKERLGPISEEQRKGLSLSLKNIDRLIAMIDNLLAFSRTEPDLPSLTPTRFGLRPLVDEVVALLEEQIAERGLQVAARFEDEGLVIRADRDKILQVFLNLLSNAVKFSHDGGRIEISADAGHAGYAAAAVKDEGVGIPREALGRIFERHYQVEQTGTGESAGSGIGLAIVRDILRLHGCTVQVSSVEGQGSHFSFTLPLAGDESGEPAGGPGGDSPPDESVPPEVPEVASGEPTLETTPPDAPEEAAIPREGGAGSGKPRPRLRIIRRYRSEG